MLNNILLWLKAPIIGVLEIQNPKIKAWNAVFPLFHNLLWITFACCGLPISDQASIAGFAMCALRL
jgi:hypothetical protein